MRRRKKFNASVPKEKWILSGEICLRRNKWKDESSYPFKISFQAFGPSHAIKVGLERIKAFVSREKKAAGIKKFMLRSVCLKSGSHRFSVKNEFQNNNILFVRRASLVFRKELVGYEYRPTYSDPESTSVDVICVGCGERVDQICETLMLAGADHKKCICGGNSL